MDNLFANVLAVLSIVIAAGAAVTSVQSTRTSKKALQLSENAHSISQLTERNRDKSVIYDLVLEWLRKGWDGRNRPDPETEQELRSLISRAVLRLGDLGDQGSTKLALVLNSYSKTRSDFDDYTFAYISGVMSVRIEALLFIWSSIEDCSEILESISKPGLNELITDAESRQKPVKLGSGDSQTEAPES